MYLAKRLHFFGSWFYKTITLSTQKVWNNNWWCIVKKKKSWTKKVESFRHSWNILQWNKNDFKSRISTNGDYFLTYVCFPLLKLWSFSLNSFLSFSCFIQGAVKRLACFYHNTAKEKYHSAIITIREVPSENSFIVLKALLTLST